MDINAIVTDRIIAELGKGSIPWQRPWVSNHTCISHATGKRYSLLNSLLLPKPGEYVTFKQAQEEGGCVRKGEKGSMVIFWKPFDKTDEDGNVIIDPDTGNPEKVFYLRYYTVFHIDQCEGIKAKYVIELPNEAHADARAEKIVAGYIQRSGATLVHEGDQAFYRPSTDTVTVPTLEQFTSTSEYYSTLFHELTHSTGHSSRLARITDVAAFGSESYSKEELIAEIGAAALVNHCGL